MARVQSPIQLRPWTPHPGFQATALDGRFAIFEMALVGDRGGGKTGLILADYGIGVQDGWKQRDSNGYPIEGTESKTFNGPWKGVMFRRHYKEFETIIDRSKEVFYGLFGDRANGGRAHFLEGEKKWLFFDKKGREIDASLNFFHMEHDADVDQWIGQELQWVGFDELPQWETPKSYLKIMASMRAGSNAVRGIRIRSTGNPGSVGIGWIKERFGIPDGPKEVVKPRSGVPIVDDKTGLVRAFILSLYEENLTLQTHDPFYLARVAASVEGDPELEKAWLDADFSALFGQYFKLFSPDIHKTSTYDWWPDGVVPAHWQVQGSLDYGENSPTSFHLWATDEHGTSICLCEHYEAGLWASEHAGKIRDLCLNNPYTKGRMPNFVWADSQIWHTRAAAGNASQRQYVVDVFRDAGLNLMKSNKDRMVGWRAFKQQLAWKKNDEGRFVKKPKLYYTDDCPNLERELRNAVHAETGNAEDIDKKCSDHALDDARYFVMGALRGYSEPAEPEDCGPSFKYYLNQAKRRKLGKPRESFIVTDTRVQSLDEALVA